MSNDPISELIEQNAPSVVDWVEVRSAQGDLLQEPVRLSELPHPGERFRFGGCEFRLADKRPVLVKRAVDFGAGMPRHSYVWAYCGERISSPKFSPPPEASALPIVPKKGNTP